MRGARSGDEKHETEFRLVVYGTPRPAGSKRALPAGGKIGGRPIVVDASPKSRPWKNEVAHHARNAMLATHRLMFRSPIMVTMTFYLRRPKSHYNARGDVKGSAPKYPGKRPDVLKLTRAVEDAMTGIVYVDDALIVHERIAKRYLDQALGNGERVEVVVWYMP